MSERVRETFIASLLASKRFVVAVCAAVAMVLGAMSAGASVFTGSTDAAQSSQAATIVFSGAQGSTPSKETPFFSRRSPLNSGQVVAPTPQYTTDASANKKGLNLKLNQDLVMTVSATLFFNPTPEESMGEPAAGAAPTDPPATNPSERDTTPTESSDPVSEPTPPADPTPHDPTAEPGLNNISPSTDNSNNT